MKQSVDGFITHFHYRHDNDHILELVLTISLRRKLKGLNTNLHHSNVYKNKANQRTRQTRECKNTAYRDVLILRRLQSAMTGKTCR
jgi:hypothetical protein